MLAPIRWLFNNLSTLILSFALAVVVWISAVTAADPNVERVFNVPIEVNGLDPNMDLVNRGPTQVRITLRAPRSVWDLAGSSENIVNASIDLTGLEAGSHTVDVNVQVNKSIKPLQKGPISPESVTVTLEQLVSHTFQVQLDVTGDPAVGYQKGLPGRSPALVTVSGPESQVSQVKEVHASLDITDTSETIKTKIPVLALDANGEPVTGITITPNEITITQPISLLGGYRNVVVKVVTAGQVANGYKLTNVSVSPPNVVVFSTDPLLVKELPSFVETEPLDLTGAENDIDTLLALNLPEGVSVVGDQSVHVQVSIAPIEGSLTITLPVNPIGLLPTFSAQISPDSVDVILSGPVPVLDTIQSSDIRVIVDLKGLEAGTYQVDLAVDVLPEGVKVESILPSAIEAVIQETLTPTPSNAPIPGPTPQPGG
jgi:YbbR domain-containing protein